MQIYTGTKGKYLLWESRKYPYSLLCTKVGFVGEKKEGKLSAFP